MACIIKYNNKEYSENEFRQYLSENFSRFSSMVDFDDTGESIQEAESLKKTVDSVEILLDKLNMEYETVNELPMNSMYYNNTMMINFDKINQDFRWYDFSKPFIETIKKANSYLYEEAADAIKKQNKILKETSEKYERFLKEMQLNDEQVETAIMNEAMEQAFKMYMDGNMKNTKNNLYLIEQLELLRKQMVQYSKGFFKSNTKDIVLNEDEIKYLDENNNECA